MEHQGNADEHKGYGDEKCNGEFFIDKNGGTCHGDGGGKIAKRSQLAWFQVLESANPQAVGESVGKHAQINGPRPCLPRQIKNDFLLENGEFVSGCSALVIA